MRVHGNTERVRVEATLKGEGNRLHTETNQQEEDVGGQRETRILGGELPLKESEDVIKWDLREQGVDIQAHRGRRRDTTDAGDEVLRVANISLRGALNRNERLRQPDRKAPEMMGRRCWADLWVLGNP